MKILLTLWISVFCGFWGVFAFASEESAGTTDERTAAATRFADAPTDAEVANASEPEADARKAEKKTEDTGAKPAVESGRAEKHPEDGFRFGTYGRVQASGNFEGEPGKSANIVAHGARLMEGPYVELDFGYGIHTDDGFGVKVLATVAFMEELFHFTGETRGDAMQAIALRNLYAMAENFIPDVDLKLWIGSRMYRGDDIYLLDFWPLDNLNTLGGGLEWNGYDVRLQAHVGVNRLRRDYQFRSLSVPATFGADDITLMERMRVISSFKAAYHLMNLKDDFSMKFALYGEFHHLPKGTFRYSEENAAYLETFGLDEEPGWNSELPADRGGVAGVQIGMWGFGENAWLNLFLRYAWDLAAYGEWGVPVGVALDRTAKGAKEIVGALSFNWDSRWVGVNAGAYGRYFEDADRNRYDMDDYWEGILAVRPAIFVTRHFHQMFEVSHQWKRPNGRDEQTDRRLTPQVWQASVIPTLSLQKGWDRRVQFRLVYTASHLDGDARALYPAFDVRKDEAWQHYFGAQVEWWLDSSSY